MLSNLHYVGNLSERVPEVSAAVTLLVENARQRDGHMTGRLQSLASCIKGSDALKAAFHKGSKLFTPVNRLMQAAAADPPTYTDVRSNSSQLHLEQDLAHEISKLIKHPVVSIVNPTTGKSDAGRSQYNHDRSQYNHDMHG
jgi:hypothetical protein